MGNESVETPDLTQHLVCVSLDIRLWSGRRKLSPKDLLKVSPEHLPPQDLASLGSKKICDPAELTEFARLKRRAERLLLESGYRFLGGYGIPADKLAAVREDLQQLQGEFRAYKQQFLARYEQTVETWVSRHAAWETIIRKAVTPLDQVRDRLSFNFRVFRVAPAADTVDGEDRLFDSSYHAIVREIARFARDTWTKTFEGQAAVAQRALGPVRKMRDKLSGLSFVDPRLYPLVEKIDGVLIDCPKTGKIADAKLNELQMLVLLLSDGNRMVHFGEASITQVNADQAPETVPEESDAVCGDTGMPETVVTDETEAPPSSQAPERAPAVVESGLFF